MTEKEEREIIPSKGGILYDLNLRIKLIIRLLRDSRVNPILKMLPIGSFIYLIVPDLAWGPVDDAAIIWMGAFLFVELCPPDVVQEHMTEMERTVEGEWRDSEGEEEIIDAEYWEEK